MNNNQDLAGFKWLERFERVALIISGASSYAICNRGIEIQVNTNPAYRRQGLATIVSAALLVESLKTGRAPHWDAGNPESAQLAKKLGFIPLGTYKMLLRLSD